MVQSLRVLVIEIKLTNHKNRGDLAHVCILTDIIIFEANGLAFYHLELAPVCDYNHNNDAWKSIHLLISLNYSPYELWD